jgi:16S rRNA (adenine1518-N6/adenine1519-N6)-dimethyltransferase
MKVAPGAFTTPPAVQSAVERIDVAPRPRVSAPVDAVFAVARAGFGTGRKQLRNALAGGLRIAPADADSILRAAGIDPARRAETLSLAEWDALAAEWQKRSA